ncbi:MAG: putative aminohydrolase SsnA [Candidatus Hodarchaeales archaeon]|jgi:putative selenium metabolism protein SsnA
MDILIKNGVLLTMDEGNQVLKSGALLIQDDIIRDIGENSSFEKEYSEAAEILDAKGRVVMPGFICSHMHLYSAFATGIPLPPFPKGFVEVLENLWWKIDKALLKEDIYQSALLGYIQAIKSGTTTIFDHHASPSYIAGSLDEIEKAGRELGVRSNLCYEVTNRNGDEGAEEGLRENERFIEKCQSAGDDLIGGLLGLHASFTINEEIMVLAQALAEQLETGIHIHVAEGKADMVHSRQNFNSTVVERLHKYRLLNPKSILAHCIHLEDTDYPIIQETRANVVHQPRSNMNNAVGTLDIWKLKANSIPFGLGTDGMSADMKAEILVGALIHKHARKDNTVDLTDVFDALFRTNPRIVQQIQGAPVGQLAVHNKADVIITGYYPKSPIDATNVLGHVLFGVIHEPVDSTIINGRICMQEGVIPNINEQEISERSQKLAENVWDRLD